MLVRAQPEYKRLLYVSFLGPIIPQTIFIKNYNIYFKYRETEWKERESKTMCECRKNYNLFRLMITNIKATAQNNPKRSS